MGRRVISLLPDWLIRKVAGYPAGLRMPHRTKYWESGGYKPIGAFDSRNFWERQGDALSRGDYRYWCGLDSSIGAKKGFATCRACGEIIFTKKERKEHMKAACGPGLERAFKMLKRSTDCIICLKETRRKVYGIPMCNSMCEKEWEFTTATPIGLRYALDDVME